jgi:hypothetical protein
MSLISCPLNQISQYAILLEVVLDNIQAILILCNHLETRTCYSSRTQGPREINCRIHVNERNVSLCGAFKATTLTNKIQTTTRFD